VRSRRRPAAGSSARTFVLVAWRVTERTRVCPAAENACPGGVARAARSSASASVRRWLTDADEHGQDRQALAGGRAESGGAVPGCLALVDLGLADRAPGHPRSPPGRVLGRPLRDVQVEGAHPGEAFTMVQPRDRDFGLLAGRGVCRRLLPGPPALLPAAGDL